MQESTKLLEKIRRDVLSGGFSSTSGVLLLGYTFDLPLDSEEETEAVQDSEYDVEEEYLMSDIGDQGSTVDVNPFFPYTVTKYWDQKCSLSAFLQFPTLNLEEDGEEFLNCLIESLGEVSVTGSRLGVPLGKLSINIGLVTVPWSSIY